ncbi:hypothetical protein F4778DRAFT_784556 [Xylariomycetidae sp. FL2044]|nr:hypothetical protein F4778DRAFT_784556 [Xylariomycetidae sp. FL2044]
MNKSRVYAVAQFHAETNVFGTLDRERHRQERKVTKLYGNVLSDRSLRAIEPPMDLEILGFLRQLLKVDEFQLYDMAVADHDGPNLVFRRRGDYWMDLEP